MAHVQQLKFIKSVTNRFANNFTEKKVLDICSFDVNGTIRNFFRNSIYFGVDLIDGHRA